MTRPPNRTRRGARRSRSREENPDPTTRREAFELDLMDEGLVEEGRDVVVDDDGLG